MNGTDDLRIRTRAFEWLREQAAIHEDILPRHLLAEGFRFEGERVPLVGPQGIFKPRRMALPLSITTAPDGPYADELGAGWLWYRYRRTGPDHPDNAGLRRAMARRVPLVYFHGILRGKYVPAWPVFIVGDDPSRQTFRVQLDDADMLQKRLGAGIGEGSGDEREDEGRRAFVTRTYQQRLHQRRFRERVLQAYRDECALCRLRHRELLDAAHIVPDGEPGGDPVVPNGLAPSAGCITPPSTGTSSASGRTTWWRSGGTSSRRRTAPC